MFNVGDMVCTNNKKLVGVIVDINARSVIIAVVWNDPPFALGCKHYTTQLNKIQLLPKGTRITFTTKDGRVTLLKYKNYDNKRRALYGENGEVLLYMDTDKLVFDFDFDDVVNHPKHYTQGNIEVIDYIEDKKLGYHLGNVVKYVSRAGHKNNALEDLKKARWYLDRMIKIMEEINE